jgi:hypothetical protein
MTVRVSWYDQDETIILYTFGHDWAWTDYYPAFEMAVEMEHSKDHRVDVIVDYQLPTQVPPGLLDNLRTIVADQPMHQNFSVLVSSHHVAVMMLGAAANIIPTLRGLYRVAASIPEALAIIEQDRLQSLSV